MSLARTIGANLAMHIHSFGEASWKRDETKLKLLVDVVAQNLGALIALADKAEDESPASIKQESA